MSNSGNFHLSIILSAINRTGSTFNAIQRQSDRLEERTQRFQNAQNSLMSIGTGLSVGMAGYVIKKGTELEDTILRFNVLLRDGEKAKNMMKELNEFANFTPFSNSEVYQAAGYLLPFIKDTKVMKNELNMIGAVAKGTNTSFTELAEKYGRFKAQGTLHMQDIYELTGRGFDVNLIKKAVGMNDLEKASKDNKLTFEVIRKAMMSTVEAGGMYEGMIEKAAGTTSGKFSTAMGTAEYAVSNMALKLMPTLSKILDDIIPIVEATSDWVEKNPKLAKTLMEVALGLTSLSVGGKILNFMYSGTIMNISKFASLAVNISKVSQAYALLKEAQAAGDMVRWYRTLENYGQAGNTAAAMLGRARITQLGFNTAVLANPYVIAIGALVAFGAAIYMVNEKMTELTNTQEMELELLDRVTDSLVDQQTGFNDLWEKLKKAKEGSQEQREIIKQLNQQYPNYVKNLNLEKASLGELPGLYQKATEAMINYSMKQLIAEKQGEVNRDIIKAQFEEMVASKRLKTSGGNVGDWMSKNFGMTAPGMIGYEFSQSKDVMNAKDKQRKGQEDLKSLQEIAASLAAKEKQQQPIIIHNELKVDGQVMAKNTNEVNRVNNRGKITP